MRNLRYHIPRLTLSLHASPAFQSADINPAEHTPRKIYTTLDLHIPSLDGILIHTVTTTSKQKYTPISYHDYCNTRTQLDFTRLHLPSTPPR